MALGLFAAALTAVIFIDVLWAVGGSLTITVSGTEVTIPGYLVLGVCLYSFVFTTAMVAIGRRLPVIIQTRKSGRGRDAGGCQQNTQDQGTEGFRRKRADGT